MKAEAEKRLKTILNAIVKSYITHAEPVGSRTLSKGLDLDLSPATIRNVMADLTDQGFLAQPHTSAGRIPTDKAYRFYVDTFKDGARLQPNEKNAIDRAMLDWTGSMSKTLENATKMLANLTDFASVLAAPNVNTTRLQMIEFIKISSHQIFVVLITKSNMVYHKVLDITEDLEPEFLDSISHYLNTQFSEKSLEDIRKQLLDNLMEEKEQYDQLLAHVMRLSKKAFDFTEERALYVEGQFNLIRDTQSTNSIQRFLKTLEEKILVLDLLDETMTAKGVSIMIGMENGMEELQDFSVVSANYGNGLNILGSLAVIGPTRMNYLRIVPIIDYTAKMLTQTIAKN